MPAEILTEIFAFFVPDAFGTSPVHNKYSVHSKVIRKGIGMLLQTIIIPNAPKKYSRDRFFVQSFVVDKSF
jgi:hypothetical protein